MMSKNRPNQTLDLIAAGLLFALIGIAIVAAVAVTVVIGWNVGRLVWALAGWQPW